MYATLSFDYYYQVLLLSINVTLIIEIPTVFEYPVTNNKVPNRSENGKQNPIRFNPTRIISSGRRLDSSSLCPDFDRL